MPPTWTYECDEDLVHFLYDHIGKEDENLGSVKQYVDSIDVSSYTVSCTWSKGTGLDQPCCAMGLGSMCGGYTTLLWDGLVCAMWMWRVRCSLGGERNAEHCVMQPMDELCKL